MITEGATVEHQTAYIQNATRTIYGAISTAKPQAGCLTTGNASLPGAVDECQKRRHAYTSGAHL